MSAETLLLLIAGAMFTLISSLLVAWFAHRLSTNENAALQRAQQIRDDTQNIMAKLEAQAESTRKTGELLAILRDRLDDRSDRLTIVESGYSGVVTNLAVLRTDLHNHMQWTREQFRVSDSAT